jgi:hypothetical protein
MLLGVLKGETGTEQENTHMRWDDLIRRVLEILRAWVAFEAGRSIDLAATHGAAYDSGAGLVYLVVDDPLQETAR